MEKEIIGILKRLSETKPRPCPGYRGQVVGLELNSHRIVMTGMEFSILKDFINNLPAEPKDASI